MPKSECEMIGKGISGPVSLVEHLPGVFFTPAAFDMLLRDAAGPPNGSFDRQRLSQRSPTGEARPVGNGALLKMGRMGGMTRRFLALL
jgi:hypothetical protein